MKKFAKSSDSSTALERSGFLWNMIGSALYALTSMLLGVVVMRILGDDLGGIFFFAFSTMGQHIYIVSYFGMRPVQITDLKRSFSFADFHRFRLITCAAALVTAILFGLLYAGLSLKATVIVIVSAYKILDGLADCYESEFQRNGRLDLTGKSMTFRTLFVVLCFLLSLFLTKDLVISCIAAVASLGIALVILCILPLRKLPDCDYRPREGAGRELFKISVWLFVSAFLDLYVFSASKYAIDATQTAAVSGYYSILFIPTNIINLLANFVIRPVLTKLTEDYHAGNMEAFRRKSRRIVSLIAAFTILGMLAAYLLGIPVLRLVLGDTFAETVTPYRTALVLLILGGGFYAILNLMYYELIIFRKQKLIFGIYVFGTVLASALCFVMARRNGIDGAALSYVICMAAVTAVFTAVTIKTERATHEQQAC